MSTAEGRDRMTAIAEKYNEILHFEQNARPALYDEIVELMNSGHANGAEIARALGINRQRIYQIKAEHDGDET